MKGIAALGLGAFLALPRLGGAIELSLEENRARRGSIGHVDMQRLFKTFPETLRAKENFEELLRQAEEQLGLRKTEILRLRQEISALKMQRELLARTPLVVSTSPAPEAPPEAPTVAASTAAPAPGDTLIINLPGLATGPALAGPPQAAGESTPPPGTAPAALAEWDAKIDQKGGELARKEKAFKEHQASTEKNLLELESRKTEMILGRIYKAIREVARREGVSVVVDKSSILFGHDAVDLTDKVLKSLGDSR